MEKIGKIGEDKAMNNNKGRGGSRLIVHTAGI
jgi:hypothetical protein